MLLLIPIFAKDFGEEKVVFGIKYFGISIHPQSAINAPLMPLKVDPQGILVINLGLALSSEYYLFDYLSIKAVQALYLDCIGQPAGFSHIGLRGQILKFGNFSLNGGIGPTFIYRKSWYKVRGYDDRFSFFNGNYHDPWQSRFLWYGGEFELNYLIDKDLELSFSIIPGGSDLINLSLGIKFII